MMLGGRDTVWNKETGYSILGQFFALYSWSEGSLKTKNFKIMKKHQEGKFSPFYAPGRFKNKFFWNKNQFLEIFSVFMVIFIVWY